MERGLRGPERHGKPDRRFPFYFFSSSSSFLSISYLRGVFSPFGTEAELGISWGKSDFVKQKGDWCTSGMRKEGEGVSERFLCAM